MASWLVAASADVCVQPARTRAQAAISRGAGCARSLTAGRSMVNELFRRFYRNPGAPVLGNRHLFATVLRLVEVGIHHRQERARGDAQVLSLADDGAVAAGREVAVKGDR